MCVKTYVTGCVICISEKNTCVRQKREYRVGDISEAIKPFKLIEL
jgi:hypothetical protein